MKQPPPENAHLWETPVSSELIYDGAIVHLYRDNIVLSNGKPAKREYIRHIGAVCVLPLTEAGEVICVRQYRYPFADVLLEIPAGKLDRRDEDPREAALRELKEETGAIGGSLTDLGVYYGSPAILDERIHMFLAESLTFEEAAPDEDEFLETVRIPLLQLKERILRGEVPDGKTQCAVLRVAAMLEQRNAQ